MYLLDTNVLSELRKQGQCDPNVAAWHASVPQDALFLSALVIGEIRKGIEVTRRRNTRQAVAIEGWLNGVTRAFDGRILPVDADIADVWGRMSADRSRPAVDTMLAATARAHSMTLVTRNLADVADLDVQTLNPFEFRVDGG